MTSRVEAGRAAPRMLSGRIALGCAVAVAATLLTACGNDRTRPPDLARPFDPRGFERFRSDGGDVSLPAPAHWLKSGGVAPAVVTYSSGDAAITVWAYPRSVIPETDADLAVAKRLLLKSLRKRDPSLKLTTKKVTRVNGVPAIELEGRGRIEGHAVRIRNVHLYKRKGEYVVDAYASPAQFRRANRIAFGRVIDGIRVGGDPPSVSLHNKPLAPKAPALGGGD